MKISIIHPSRSRPDKAYQTAIKWLNRIGEGVEREYILSIDLDDPYRAEYERLFLGRCIHTSVNRSAIDAINKAAKISTGDILIQIAEDFDCPNNWGNIIQEATKDENDWLLKVNDGTQGWIVTLPIMDRSFYESNGYFYYPEFSHMFVDTDLTHKADIQKKIIWRNDIIFEHQHYSTGKTQKDTVSEKADKTWNQGEALYLKRCREGFGTKLDIWDISMNGIGHRNWLKRKLK